MYAAQTDMHVHFSPSYDTYDTHVHENDMHVNATLIRHTDTHVHQIDMHVNHPTCRTPSFDILTPMLYKLTCTSIDPPVDILTPMLYRLTCMSINPPPSPLSTCHTLSRHVVGSLRTSAGTHRVFAGIVRRDRAWHHNTPVIYPFVDILTPMLLTLTCM